MGQVHDARPEGATGAAQAHRTGIRHHDLYIGGRPHPKERPRFSKTGVAYTPEKTRTAERRIRQLWDGPKYSGPVELVVTVDVDGTSITVIPRPELAGSKLRGDLTNYLKTVEDGLNNVAWDDDIQVVKITAMKL